MPLLELFLTFLKIGAVSFGGGYAMIPLVTDEVIAHGWLTAEEILNFIAVSESTPGPIAINMATFVGASQGGILGAMLATLGVVLPSFVIILIIASVIKGLLKFAGVKAFLNGLRPVVVGLIVGTAITMFLSVILSLNTVYEQVTFDWKALVIFFVAAITHFVYKKITNKNVSPILLIIISALLGMLFYGVL
ncbi:MAG: chromate transporter [Clostridia bacterium]|nr:chromate transporter [Clostridia bacterium]MBR2449136.1 chromate transporter [Clostridia bacterium]